MDKTTTIQELKDFVLEFIKEREWNKFHTPKNLSMQIAAEAAELMEHFLWVEGKESVEMLQKNGEEIKHEIADVFVGILIICAENNIDLSEILKQKMAVNAQRYPVEKAKGKSTKYTKL